MASGVPRPFDVWCLVDQQELFQLEVFEFPGIHPMLPEARRCDIGYASVAVHVADFDRTLVQAAAAGTPPLTEPVGQAGHRRVCVRDPEGVFLELMEDDLRRNEAAPRARPEVPSCTRGVTISVPDLVRARRLWVDTLGFVEADGPSLHTREHERLWGLEGAQCETLLLWGGDILLELVQYTEPVGRPRRAGHHYTDQGILNLAVLAQTADQFDALFRRVCGAGYKPDWPPIRIEGVSSVVYITDDQGFSIELMYVDPAGLEYMGFVPVPA